MQKRISKIAINNLEFIYKQTGINDMEKTNIFTILEFWNHYGNDFRSGLKFWIVMFLLTSKDLNRGWAVNNVAQASSFLIKELRNFDYESFKGKSVTVTHSPELCAELVSELLSELSVKASNINRNNV